MEVNETKPNMKNVFGQKFSERGSNDKLPRTAYSIKNTTLPFFSFN
jgi:hypothetical protein